MTYEDNKPWRKKILLDLQARNRRQCDPFAELIKSHARLLESSESYKAASQRASLEVERLRAENEDLKQQLDAGANVTGSAAAVRSEKLQMLEQKLYKAQEELMEFHRKKGENAQAIIDLNIAVQERDKSIAMKDARLKELEQNLGEISSHCHGLEQDVTELQQTNQVLLDEQQALQMAFTSLELKMRELQNENVELVTRWMALKAKDADRMNAENEEFVRMKQDRERLELMKAATEGVAEVTLGPKPRSSGGELLGFVMSVPSRALQTIEAHDGEVNALKWSPSGLYFATGGSDRKVKLWEVHGVKCEPKAMLVGCNAGITAIDMDLDDKLLLAASNDFASRIWTASDQRLRHTLTGHSGKVLAAKFLSDPNHIVSGSHDRTLKLWDVRTTACTKTIFAGSSCNDIAVVDGYNVVSAHFDKKLRFYDLRTDSSTVREILLDGRITSVDLTLDKKRLLGCTRNNSLTIVDLPSGSIQASLSADGFHVAVDWTRAIFSPDDEYIAAGSSDGAVYIWQVATSKLHSVLKDHRDAVTACAWNPSGRSLLSCDKHKTVIFWSD